MTTTFDLWQQAYSLASMSGSVSTMRGEPARLADDLNENLNSFYSATATKNAIGTWSTVWGPVVFENKPNILGVADNVMYVAANAETFAEQAEYQHTTAYDVLLDVQSLFPSGSSNADAYAGVVRALFAPHQME